LTVKENTSRENGTPHASHICLWQLDIGVTSKTLFDKTEQPGNIAGVKVRTNMAKKRKTRLKGTETEKPCFDCGVTKDRFKDFKPRWAGCVNHRTERGRRYQEPGCADCAALVNGNIRQPRCIECDAARPKTRKKRKKAAAAPEPTVAVVETAVAVAEPEPAPEPEPVAVNPEPAEEPAEEATSVVVPEKAEAKPEPEPVKPKKAKRPKLATMDDLSALFGDD
jgi:hypothetical protein